MSISNIVLKNKRKRSMKPLVLVNFKIYKEALGNKALEIAKRLDSIKKNGDKYEVAIAPSLLTLKEVTQHTKHLTVYSQHTDHVPFGAHTGRISVDELRNIGVGGTILNHSERKIPMKYLEEIIKICKLKRLKTIVCASTLSEIKKVAMFKPHCIAYEPKELIGGDVSVTESHPDLIVKAVELVYELSPRTKLLCGAGIHSKEDLGHALLLGADGVLIGHAITRAKDPKKFLQEMLL